MPNQTMVTPFFLDTASLELENLVQSGWKINKPELPEGETQQRLSAIHEPIAAFVADTLKRGDRPISIAGDCCTTIGYAAGLQRAGIQPTLMWLDAHGDFNTWETTPSKFLGGMPLAMMVGLGEQTMPNAVGLKPFPQNQVIIADGRDLDPGEKQLLDDSQVTVIGDIGALLEHPRVNNPLWVHFDTDILNPDDAPAMSYRAEGGPRAVDLKAVFQQLAATGRVVAISMTTWTPNLDTDGRSQAVCMDLLHTLVG